MPVFFARWRDGSFSIVNAADEADAYVELDEIADDPAEVSEMQSCLLDFGLTDSGTFQLIEMGRDTAEEILKRGYPRLRKALARVSGTEYALVDRTHSEWVGIETAKNVCKAAKAEQSRLRNAHGRPIHRRRLREGEEHSNYPLESGPVSRETPGEWAGSRDPMRPLLVARLRIRAMAQKRPGGIQRPNPGVLREIAGEAQVGSCAPRSRPVPVVPAVVREELSR